MRVLVTRPREDAEALVRELHALGHDALVEPLLEIRVRVDVVPDLDGVQAILFTSANGVRAFAAKSRCRDLPVLAVGEATAEVARSAGFRKVESAAGDAQSLACLVRSRLTPDQGLLYHAAGTITAGALKETLGAAGFQVRRQTLYDAVPSSRLSDPARRALENGTLDAVLFFSPRTADTFVKLVESTGDVSACSTLEAVCLSGAVADKAGALPWRRVRVAERPERAALLRTLADSAAIGRQTNAKCNGHEGCDG